MLKLCNNISKLFENIIAVSPEFLDFTPTLIF